MGATCPAVVTAATLAATAVDAALGRPAALAAFALVRGLPLLGAIGTTAALSERAVSARSSIDGVEAAVVADAC
jgi:hypothetical protein